MALCRAETRPTVVSLLLLALLAGCATQPGKVPGNRKDLAGLDQWRIDGKLGFRSPEKNGSAWLRWQQHGSAYELHLNGPFGAASTAIRGDKDFAVLSQSGREDFTAENGETLTRELFGWQFPVTEMPYWVKGIAAPGQRADATYNDRDLLTALQQSGWQLEFSDYATFGAWSLPTRIKGKQADYGFTLVVKNWHPAAGRTGP